MTSFILGCIMVFVIFFLAMIAIQLIRIEKNIGDIAEIAQRRVQRLYKQGGLS